MSQPLSFSRHYVAAAESRTDGVKQVRVSELSCKPRAETRLRKVSVMKFHFNDRTEANSRTKCKVAVMPEE